MAAWVQILGGVGLFLFGMAVMTSGLGKLAGDRLRGWLARSTKTPVSGAMVGATVTALIQSSSATTVAAIGFVGAGLISFTASLGVIFGANIGTTITGWMVALLGFKLKLTAAALPLLFVGSICYLFKRIRSLRGFGKALAGFSLLFIGIGYLQLGLEQHQDLVDFSQWTADSFGGRILLVLIGIVLTLITQSSSATVATALTALNAGMLDLPQAAAVIIGADIGTTGTAALATIGGTTASRRTGFAHVIYNMMTGIAAFFMLPLYLMGVEWALPDASIGSPEMVAVGFHSVFNVLGVVVVLPFTKSFGQFIERLFPEHESPLSTSFDKHLLVDPRAASAGLEYGCLRLATETLQQAAAVLDPKSGADPETLTEVLEAIELGREFAVKTAAGGGDDADIDSECIFDCVHLLDHIERLVEHVDNEAAARSAMKDADLRSHGVEVAVLIGRLADDIRTRSPLAGIAESLREAAEELEQDNPRFRRGFIRSAAKGDTSGHHMDSILDAHRWLRRMAYHSARIAHYGVRVRYGRDDAQTT